MCGGQSVAERIRPIVHLVFACDNMNEKPRDDTSIGQLIRAASKSIRPPVLDCSGWDAENPSEQWSTGKLISVTKSLPAVEGSFTLVDSLSLEIALRLDPGVDPARAFTLAVGLIGDLLTYDPSLGLCYDAARSRSENSRVTLVLTPTRPGPDAAARLEKIAGVIQKAADKVAGFALNGVRILPAA
jgi:hypothetical protein